MPARENHQWPDTAGRSEEVHQVFRLQAAAAGQPRPPTWLKHWICTEEVWSQVKEISSQISFCTSTRSGTRSQHGFSHGNFFQAGMFLCARIVPGSMGTTLGLPSYGVTSTSKGSWESVLTSGYFLLAELSSPNVQWYFSILTLTSGINTHFSVKKKKKQTHKDHINLKFDLLW